MGANRLTVPKVLRRILFWLIRLLPASIRRNLYLYLKQQSVQRNGPTDFFVQRLPLGLYLKQGLKASQEALTIQLVSKHLATPVPEILDVVDELFIMTSLEGEVLGDLFSEMSEDEALQVRRELGSVVQQLRAVPRQDERSLRTVSGALPSLPCCDVNRVDDLEFGPFPTIAAFHSHLLQKLPPNIPLRATYALSHGLVTQTTEGEQPSADSYEETVFTHGDLNLRNILVKRTVSSSQAPTVVITGIIDWTCAGWYPMYWEHGKAIYPQSRFKRWTDTWNGIAEDTVPEHKRQKFFNDLGLERSMWPYLN